MTLVTDPFDPAAATVSPDGRTAFTSIQYDKQTLERAHYDQAVAAIEATRAVGIQTEISGSIAMAANPVEGREGIGLVVAVIVLLAAFGSVIAMSIPIGTAILGLATGSAGIGILAGAISVPDVSPMLAAMIGLGVGIDYALFVVTRHRQHLSEGLSVADAAGRANATAGQSVLFAGTTVVIALAGLVLADVPAITTMGVAVAIVVLVAMAMAVCQRSSGWPGRTRPHVGAADAQPDRGRRRQSFHPFQPLGLTCRSPALALRHRQPAAVGRLGRAHRGLRSGAGQSIECAADR